MNRTLSVNNKKFKHNFNTATLIMTKFLQGIAMGMGGKYHIFENIKNIMLF